MWTLKSLMEHCNSVATERNGTWVPARPLPYFGWWGVKGRIKDSLKVLIGKTEAFEWPEGQ